MIPVKPTIFKEFSIKICLLFMILIFAVIIKIQDSQLVGYQMTNDYKGNDFTASVTTVNNDIIQNSGKLL